MLQFDEERVRANVQQASTEDLLDRLTAYRNGMEPEALELIEAELVARGIGAEEIQAHGEARSQTVIRLPDGTARQCSFCERPAVMRGWGWHRWWGLVPLFPRTYSYCDRHAPEAYRPISPASDPGRPM